MEIKNHIMVIGGGAAGFFSAIQAAQENPSSKVTIVEKSSKLLAKVKVSGGGRCNVTHNEMNNRILATNYPRGEKFLRKAFSQFSVKDTVEWFQSRGVDLKVEKDNRMFPETNDSQTIIDIFLKQAQQLEIEVKKKSGVLSLSFDAENNVFNVQTDEELFKPQRVILATGGGRTREKYDLALNLGHSIMDPVPSLFTFNLSSSRITELMGLSVSNASVKILGSKFVNHGPLLITHWGFSGPAVLKLSALASRYLAEEQYQFTISINWMGDLNENQIRERITEYISENGKKKVSNGLKDVPKRLWDYFLYEVSMDGNKTWNSIDKKSKNRLINIISNSQFQIKGKTTFKEEFVTCGGVELGEINPKTMESKIQPGLFFAGEFLDIDGVTGGFNFQAAWTTGYIAGSSLSLNLE